MAKPHTILIRISMKPWYKMLITIKKYNES